MWKTSGTYCHSKYLTVPLNNNIDALQKWPQKQALSPGEPSIFWVALLKTFYGSVIASAISYNVECWSNSITESKKMDKNIRKSSSFQSCPTDYTGGGEKKDPSQTYI